ncbi:EAL domain-containing protein [Domibacillus sp. A3M-37]|uniref:putative bifunctional diguanylate cyclase/phosphodiesterase n=1 Tax=Domibacillus sp. A3M-37 TaxID=2962037 RepID=UPI0020B8C91A|nr:EAL domain-containing protein [Domibacillus sp. A3M-37]MCP3764890.1 EAL domain-containing protein [Domibacillus sp. A3M-37]
MASVKRPAFFFILIYLFTFYTWIFIFRENDWMRFLGTNIFSMAGSTVSFIWLFQTYRVTETKYRYFWLLLSVGALFYIVSYGICFYYQNILSITLPSPSRVDAMWLTTYSIYLAAFIYRAKLMFNSVSIKPFAFNIVLFMIIVTTISLQYIIEPVFALSDHSISFTFVTSAYPIFDLGFLFFAISFYYLSQYRDQKNFFLIISIGFFIQIIGDLLYVYYSVNHTSVLGHFIDPLWQIPLLLKGLAGLYAQEHPKETSSVSPYYVKSNYNIFLYASVLFILMLIIYNNYRYVDFLVIGFSLSILFIIVRQISIMKKNEKLLEEYKYLAYHDPLTSLYNRSKFTEDAQEMLYQAKSNRNMAALLLIDLDRFKGVNDTLGHYVGDSLLKEFSQRIQTILQERGIIYRIGGDEFLILLPQITDMSLVVAIAESILTDSSKPFSIKGNELVITSSIGISIYPEHGEDTELLFKNADAAMYLAKEKGKNNFQFYNPALHDLLFRKMNIENGLRKAIEKNQFSLHYQPKVDMHTGKIIGMEALLRWEHPEWGVVSPAEFIPVAEETGQIVSIGEWVLKTACEQTKKWQNTGLPSICLSVNVSVRQFQQNDFIQTVRNILQETHLDAHFLELEITESIIQNLKQSTEILYDLRVLGVRTSIDDFGTGYSSLHCLKTLPIDIIKLDKSFIDDLNDPANQAIVKAITEIGTSLNLQVIAEGIEQEQQVEMLLKHNCRYGQGYLFGRPVPAQEFEKHLLNNRNFV